MKKWKCTVCGYVHTGPEPPEKCPVCGASRDKFVELNEEEARAAEAAFAAKRQGQASAVPASESSGDRGPAGPGSGPGGFLVSLLGRLHAHPISVHTPNGVLPAAVLFLVLSFVFKAACLEEASFYSLAVVVLAMPAVMVTGLVDWKTHYQGAVTPVFVTKMACAGMVFGIGLFLVGWRIFVPEVAAADSAQRWLYVLLHLVMLVPAMVAGGLGGRLVFGK